MVIRFTGEQLSDTYHIDAFPGVILMVVISASDSIYAVVLFMVYW